MTLFSPLKHVRTVLMSSSDFTGTYSDVWKEAFQEQFDLKIQLNCAYCSPSSQTEHSAPQPEKQTLGNGGFAQS